MAQRTSLLFLLTGLLLTHTLASPHVLVAIGSDDEEGPPHKKRRLNSPPQAASATPLAQAAPIEEASSAVPPCAPKKPKKPQSARKVLTSAHTCNPWDKEGFLWTRKEDSGESDDFYNFVLPYKKLFKPCTHIGRQPYLPQNPRQEITWAEFMQQPLHTEARDTWQQDRIRNQPRRIDISSCYVREQFAGPWESDPNFFNTRGFARVQSFVSQVTIKALPPFSFSNNLVHLSLSLPTGGRALCEGIGELSQLRSLTLSTTDVSRHEVRAPYNSILAPLSQLERLQHFHLGFSYFGLYRQAQLDNLLLDLGNIVKNNPNLRELYVGDTENRDTKPRFSGIEKALADRAFEVLALKGWAIKSLAWINTEKLRELDFYIAGTIEEGFSQPPSHLTELRIDRTYFTFPFFETLPLEQITDVDLQAPCDLKVLAQMRALRNLRIWGEDFWHCNDNPSPCLQDLDYLQLDNLEDANLHISTVDFPFAKMALTKRPELLGKLTYVERMTDLAEPLEDAIRKFEEGPDEDSNAESEQDSESEGDSGAEV